MTEPLSSRELREAAAISGEMAASRLHDLIQSRFKVLQDAGESQADIARRMGASPQIVGRWLAEPRNMTVKSVGRLLSAMKAHLEFQLDCYEDIERGNGASAHPPSLKILTAPSSVSIDTFVGTRVTYRSAKTDLEGVN